MGDRTPWGRLQSMMLRAYGRLPRRVRTFAVRRVAPPFRVGAMCVVERDDGSVLLLRNSYRKGWGLPGGLLRRGEEVDAAARREVREETGISVELAGPPGVIVDARARRRRPTPWPTGAGPARGPGVGEPT